MIYNTYFFNLIKISDHHRIIHCITLDFPFFLIEFIALNLIKWICLILFVSARNADTPIFNILYNQTPASFICQCKPFFIIRIQKLCPSGNRNFLATGFSNGNMFFGFGLLGLNLDFEMSTYVRLTTLKYQ